MRSLVSEPFAQPTVPHAHPICSLLLMNNAHIAGIFVQNRTLRDVWAFEGCSLDCIAHKVFNLTNPESGPGRLTITASNVTARVSLGNVEVASATYTLRGPLFGCQLDSGTVRFTYLPFPSLPPLPL